MVVVVKVGLEPLGAATVQDLDRFEFEFLFKKNNKYVGNVSVIHLFSQPHQAYEGQQGQRDNGAALEDVRCDVLAARKEDKSEVWYSTKTSSNL